jgi:hypothetical protein
MHQRFTQVDATGRARLAAGTALILASLWPVGVHGQQDADETSVELVRNAFESCPDFPWYDPEQDTIRRSDVRASGDIQNRHSRWEATLPAWQLPYWASWLLEIAAWSLLAILLAALVALLVRAFLAYEGAPAPLDERTAGGPAEDDRVEHLPFQLPQRQVSLLEEARRLSQAGHYGEAIVYLYSYQLIQLDQHHLIRLERGKTNRQYLREIRPRGAIRELLERTMIAFEDVFFGNHTLDRLRFESCWNALDHFHQQVRQASA